MKNLCKISFFLYSFLAFNQAFAETMIVSVNDLISSPETNQLNNVVHIHSDSHSDDNNIKTVESQHDTTVPYVMDVHNPLILPSDLVASIKSEAVELQTNGYFKVDNSETTRFDDMQEKLSYFKSLKTVKKNLAFRISPSGNTIIRSIRKKGYKLVGALTAGANIPDKGWTVVELLFFNENKGYLTLLEDQSDRISISSEEYSTSARKRPELIFSEFLNTTVNGSRASLVSSESPNGKSVSYLRWKDNNQVHYEITSPGNQGKEFFMKNRNNNSQKSSSHSSADHNRVTGIELIDIANGQ